LLVILDPKLGAARIEVGYSLEGVMTDLHMSRVARDQLAPYVSYGSAGMAVMDVLHYLRDYALLAAVRGDIQLTKVCERLPTTCVTSSSCQAALARAPRSRLCPPTRI
jgi:hypothetical protein